MTAAAEVIAELAPTDVPYLLSALGKLGSIGYADVRNKAADGARILTVDGAVTITQEEEEALMRFWTSFPQQEGAW